MNELILLRVLFLSLIAGFAYFVRPSDAAPGVVFAWIAALIGLSLGLEWLGRRLPTARLLGAAVGLVLGLMTALLAALVLRQALSNVEPFFVLTLPLVAAYLGLTLGAQRAAAFSLSGPQASSTCDIPQKLLDTSVIIDGRVADIAETGFLEGPLVVPQFVLRELQSVADSSDSQKRNRGRRGLDVLQRLQKVNGLSVHVSDEDVPQVREVDLKLIELAKRHGAKIVTNDFNLNKVAQVHRVEVLNINELANSLKPIVLPGETMRVFILKEGKEHNQGVAYLDDGTMVVVDNAKRMISRTIDISVTSVLQTTAGKMIFGKFDDRHSVRTGPQDGVSRETAG